MNSQLVDSLVQLILSLPTEERALLGEKLSMAHHATTSTEKLWGEEAVNVFLALGQDATPGQLKNTSVNHDRYLYGKPE